MSVWQYIRLFDLIHVACHCNPNIILCMNSYSTNIVMSEYQGFLKYVLKGFFFKHSHVDLSLGLHVAC